MTTIIAFARHIRSEDGPTGFESGGEHSHLGRSGGEARRFSAPLAVVSVFICLQVA